MKHHHFLNSDLDKQNHEITKGWSSERVPPQHAQLGSRNRHVSAASGMFPFSSGRALPSKWDDAERWICSPVEWRARSKSGPLGPQTMGNCGNYSPLMPCSLVADSPFLARSNVDDRRRSCPGLSEQDFACTREWLKLLNHPTDLEFEEQEEDDGAMEEAEIQVTRVFSRRDMGTQMVPSDESSGFSSPAPESPNMEEMVKEVKEDSFPIMETLSQSGAVKESQWEIEEAKINEWECQQREKAEAAIRKLEMKLEKKRSQAMEKIVKKVKRAELKAGKMRASLSESNEKVGTKTSRWIGLVYRRNCVANCCGCR